jgi:hypothetical protein
VAKLFNRYIAVTVGTKKITGLDMAFKVVKSVKPEPNTVELTIYNLSADTRTALQTPNVPVQIEAGYMDEAAILFKGELRKPVSVRRGADWVTTFTGGDGEIAYRASRLDKSFAPGTSLVDMFKEGAKKLGVSLGDSLQKIGAARGREGVVDFPNGETFSGQLVRELERLAKTAGVEWSIQDGVLQVTPLGEPTDEQSILLSPATGLIGSPELGEKGTIKITSLLQPGIRPARRLQLDAVNLQGSFRVERVEHTGDISAQPWYSVATCRAL